MESNSEQHLTRGRSECQEQSRRRLDPRETAEHRAAALRAIELCAMAAGISLDAAREAYNGRGLEVSAETFSAVPFISARTFDRWRAKFKTKKLPGLMPPVGNRAGCGVMDLDVELIDFVITMLGQNHLLSARQIWKAMRKNYADAGDKRLPSCGAFRRWLKRWKLTHREHFARISNPDSHKGRFLRSLGCKADEVCRPMQIVEIDGSPIDILCVDGRYYLTAAIDIFTRRAVAVVTKTASAAAAKLCLRKMLLTMSVMETLRTDQGSEYKAASFQGPLHHCGITSDPVPVFSGNRKPFIERFIGTVMHSFAPLLPGYIGSSVAERKAIESRKSFAARLGEDQNERFRVSLTAHDLQQRLDTWIADVYSNDAHAGLNGRTPNQAWRDAVAAGWKAHQLPERELDVLLADGGVRRVGKKGVRIERADFWANELVPYAGDTVRVALTDDMGAIVLFNGEDEFIAVAKNPERAGISRREMAISASAAWRAYQRAERKTDRALKSKFNPAGVLDAMTASRGAGAAPLTPVELHDVPMLRAAADAIAAGDDSRPSRLAVQSASASDRRFKEYSNLKKQPLEKLSDSEQMQIRIYESSAAFRARFALGAVA
jgi:putative transposase